MHIGTGDATSAAATTAAVAEHLGVTKQAAAYLVDRGYVERRTDPGDVRARLLGLTD